MARQIDATDADSELQKQVKQWTDEQCAHEVARIKGAGAAVRVERVKNCAVRIDLPEHPEHRADGTPQCKLVNRVEVATPYKFSAVRQIMVSPAEKCPMKPGYSYVNLILVGPRGPPMIMPYVFPELLDMEPDRVSVVLDRDAVQGILLENDLAHWSLVNDSQDSAEHFIGQYNQL